MTLTLRLIGGIAANGLNDPNNPNGTLYPKDVPRISLERTNVIWTFRGCPIDVHRRSVLYGNVRRLMADLFSGRVRAYDYNGHFSLLAIASIDTDPLPTHISIPQYCAIPLGSNFISFSTVEGANWVPR